MLIERIILSNSCNLIYKTEANEEKWGEGEERKQYYIEDAKSIV